MPRPAATPGRKDNDMTNQRIMRTVRGANHNPSIKWKVIENTSDRIVLTNDYDKGINYSIEVRRDGADEWITVRDNLQGRNVECLIKGSGEWDDYVETEQGLLKGAAIAAHDFNYIY